MGNSNTSHPQQQRRQNQPPANIGAQEQARNVDRGSKRGETANKQEQKPQANDRDERPADNDDDE